MKTILLTIATLLLFTLSSGAQPVWEELKDSDGQSLPSINCLYEGGGVLYAGVKSESESYISDIYILNPSIGNYFNGRKLEPGQRSKSIGSFLRTADGKLIVGTLSNGLWIGDGSGFNRNTNDITSDASVEALAEKNNILYAGTNKGIYRSTDAGTTWKRTNGVPDGIRVRSILAGNDNMLYAATMTSGGNNSNIGIYTSEDGQTWKQSNPTNPPPQSYSLCQLNNRIFVGVFGGIYYTTDKGDSWPSGNFSKKGEKSMATDGIYLYVSTYNSNEGIFQLSIDGELIKDITGDIIDKGKHVFSIAEFNNYLYAATENGVYRANLTDIRAPKKIDSAITLYGGMYVDLNLYDIRDRGRRWWDVDTNEIKSGEKRFEVSDDRYKLRWTAPYLESEIKNYDGSDNTKKMIILGGVLTALDPGPGSIKDITKKYAITVKSALIQPDSGKEDVDINNYNFQWHKCLPAGSYYYFYTSEDTSFSQNPITTIDTFIKSGLLLQQGKTYYWKLCYDSATNKKAILGIRSFKTKQGGGGGSTLSATKNQEPSGSVCVGENVTLTITPSGGISSGYIVNWSWNTSIFDKIYEGKNGNDFYIKVKAKEIGSLTINFSISDAVGNSYSGSFSLTVENKTKQSNILLYKTTDLCDLSSITISCNGNYNSYEWTYPGGGKSTSQSITVSTTGTYTVVAQKDGGCPVTDNVTITKNSPPKPNIQGNTSVCLGEAAQEYNVSNNQGYTQNWSVIAGEENVETSLSSDKYKLVFKQPGTVTIQSTFTSNGGCTNINTLTIIIKDTVKPNITASALSFCKGSSVKLSVTPNQSDYNYIWYRDNNVLNGKDTADIDVSDGGKYYCVIGSNKECNGKSASISISVDPLPVPKIEMDPITGELTASGEANGIPISSWQWYEGEAADNKPITNEINSLFKPKQSLGKYTVEATTDKGCHGFSTIDIPPVQPVVFKITDATGSDIIKKTYSQSVQDVYTLQLKAESVNIAEPSKHGVKKYHIKHSWHAPSIGLVKVEPDDISQRVIITKDTAVIEYDIVESKVKEGDVISTFSFLALIGGNSETDITTEAAAVDDNNAMLTRAKAEAKKATFIIDSAPILSRPPTFGIVARPNPTQNEVEIEIISKTGAVPTLDVYLADVTGRRILTFIRKSDVIYSADCSAISAGTYITAAVGGGQKQTVPIQIKK